MKSYSDIQHPDGSKTRTFADAADALQFANRMQNLGFRTKFAATYLDCVDQWWYPVIYWKEYQEEETFQDTATEAYREYRRAGGY